jgi:hypothetical protein
LRQYSDFTPAQLNEIVSAALSNNQVYWIAGDDDVHAFLSTAIRGREDQIESGSLQRLKDLLDGQVASRVMWKRGNGAFFRLVKCTTSRPPWQAATGGTRHGQEYQGWWASAGA